VSVVEQLLPLAADVELTVDGPKAGTLAGEPIESSAVLFAAGGTEIGIWECTPGSWTSSKDGFGELMHFVSGRGFITDADGRWEIRPGAVRWFPDGWTGTWEIDTVVRKVYVLVNTES